MPKLIPDFPARLLFSIEVPVRITDINYGGHVGNDRILSIIHEARMQYLHALELNELQFGETALILKTASIDFIKELFYGDKLRVWVGAGEFTRVAFALFYRLESTQEAAPVTIALAKTTMVCYDYKKRKVTALDEEIKRRLV